MIQHQGITLNINETWYAKVGRTAPRTIVGLAPHINITESRVRYTAGGGSRVYSIDTIKMLDWIITTLATTEKPDINLANADGEKPMTEPSLMAQLTQQSVENDKPLFSSPYMASWQKTAVFIDGKCLHNIEIALNFVVDYKRLQEFFQQRCNLMRIYYYAAMRENSGLRPLVDWLQYNGYNVTVQNIVERAEGVFSSSDVSVALTLDMFDLADKMDNLILCANNYHLINLIKRSRDKGAIISVMGTIQSEKSRLNDWLRREADQFIEIANIKGDICRPERVAA